MKSIEDQFNAVAREYDSGRRKFIPCFDDFYAGAVDFVSARVKAPRRILDLGAGTGLLSMYYLRSFPRAELVLADIADDMLAVARKRFAGLDNVRCMVLDYAKDLPDGGFDLIVSALSIHHLENAAKEDLFARIYRKLPDGGMLVNHDQFCAADSRSNAWFDTSWVDGLYRSGLTDAELARWRERRKLDRECSVPQEMSMLKHCGFADVECVYSNRKFSVLAGVK